LRFGVAIMALARLPTNCIEGLSEKDIQNNHNLKV
jgi:hypothetical protein